MPVAPQPLAREARQRILHHPDVAAALDRAGACPRAIKPADRPRPDHMRACGPVEPDRRTAGGGRQMGHRGVGTDIDRGAADERRELWPVELAVDTLDRRRDAVPQAIEIVSLGWVRASGRDHLETALRKRLREGAPTLVGPAA